MSNWESSAPSLERTPIHGISASGFCRVLGYVRSQQEVFPNNSGKTMAVLVGDLYREPMFLTRLKLVTQDGVQFGVDLMGNSLFKGPEVEALALAVLGAAALAVAELKVVSLMVASSPVPTALPTALPLLCSCCA